MSDRTMRWLAVCAVGSLFLTACVGDVLDLPTDDAKPEVAASSGGKEDRWDGLNAPNRFDEINTYRLSELPLTGQSARDAWASSYFPTYEDGIQHRWDGDDSLSPAEKYDRAFNGWTPPENFEELRPFNAGWGCDQEWDEEYYTSLGPLASYISNYMGNRNARDGVDSDDDGEIDECDDNDGVETWWGLCHAWVPAAMLEDAPQRAVEYNGVTFYPGDMEALLIAAYNRTSADMVGGRCNLGNDDDHPVERDEHGRPVNVNCLDTNPGSLHVIMTNYLGLGNRPFAMDRTYDYEVWNQPVVGYQVTRLQQITVEQANELLGLTGDTYDYNRDAAQLYDVNATLDYVTEAYASRTPANPANYVRQDHLRYILEVDSDGKVIGGEYYGSSRSSHPDFLWNPRRLSSSSTPHLNLDNVRMLISMSREPEVPPVGEDVIVATGRGNIAIPDNTPAGISSAAEVSESVTVGGLQVDLNLTHTYISDLEIRLSHDGVERVIWAREGGSDDNIERVLTVPGFEGVDAGGTWTLSVVDHADLDTGRLVSWRLLVTPGEGGGHGGGAGGDVVTAAGAGGLAIPDNNPTGITSRATVSRDVTVGRVQVELNVTHTYVGDLVVTLTHNGTERTLHSRSGGGSDNIHATIDVSGFEGANGRGNWTLAVRDLAGVDVGTLDSWTLRLIPGSGDTGGGGTSESFPGQGGLAIADNSEITSDAVVPASITSGSVAISVNISHTWRGDLRLVVSHGGQSWTLHDRSGGGADNIVQSFPITDAGNPGGTWTLTVSDHAAQDVGTLNSWSVVVTD